MTVRELIEALSKCDPGREVFMEDDAVEMTVARVIPDYRRFGYDQEVVLLDWRTE